MKDISLIISRKYSGVISILAFGLAVLFFATTSFYVATNGNFGFYSAFILFLGGTTVTIISKKNNILMSFEKWMLGLTVYSLVSYLVFLWFWYLPLASLGDLRTPTQMPEYQDANYYDYLAALASEAPYSDWPGIINATWLSQGVVSYLALIYKYFGTSQLNYIFFNIFFGYLSALFIQGIVVQHRNDNTVLILFAPFVLYYSITPGKEVLTNVVTYAFLYFSFVTWNQKSGVVLSRILVLILLIVLLGLIRINAALMVLLVTAIYFFLQTSGKTKFAFKLVLLSVPLLVLTHLLGLNDLLYLISNIDTHLSMLDLRLESTEVGGLKHTVARTFTSENFMINIALAPARAIIWLFAPFPFLDLLALLHSVFFEDNYVVFRAGEALCRSLSSLLMVYFCCKVFAFYFFDKKSFASQSMNFILFVTCGFTLILSTTNFVEGARYRTIIEPLAICWLLTLHSQKRFLRATVN
jgi:hypothetical protein